MYLLDTCVLIWLLSEPDKISSKAENVIKDAKELYVNICSLWEIAIKQGNGKLEWDISIEDIAKACVSNGIKIIYPAPRILDILKNLPKEHGDPFDRLIIAQAMNDKYIIITSDNKFKLYDVEVVW